MSPAVRLGLAILVALVAVVCLMSRLSAACRQAQASATNLGNESLGYSACLPSIRASGIPTRCRPPVLSVSKHVDPTDPDTGEVVTITFVITGLGLKPVDVVLVQDVSESMLRDGTGPSRLEVAQAAAIQFVNELTDTDRVAMVAYSTTARLALSLTADTEVAVDRINSLTAQEDWYTNVGDGIRAGYEELISSTRYHSRTVKAMILLSDGNVNQPGSVVTAAQHAISQAVATGECGILIYTIGFGNEVSGTLMQNLAAHGGGEYYFSSDGTDLATIYQEIALQLRNLVITDVLPTGVDLDCSLLPDDWPCVRENGLTTVTVPISNGDLVTDPLLRSFTATVNLDPRGEHPVNVEGSKICYDGPVITRCQDFVNPTATVGGRKISGIVFEDLAYDGYFNGDESVLPGVVVTTSSGLTSETDSSGMYIFRISVTPSITVAVGIPSHYVTTTSAIAHIPPISDTYQHNFGLYTGLVGEKHSWDINAPPLLEGDELAYSITIRNISPNPRPNVLITDLIPIHTSINGDAQIAPSGSGTVTVADGILTGVVDSIAPGETLIVSFLVTIDEGTRGQIIHNCAYVTSTAQYYRLSLSDKIGPVDILPVPYLSKVANSQAVMRGTEITYTYIVSNPSATLTLTNVVIEDSHLQTIGQSPFSLPPNQSTEVLTTASLTQNTTNTATVTGEVELYGEPVEGDPVTATVHVIEGFVLTQVYTAPVPMYHGDTTTLYYSIVNQDSDDSIVSGTTRIIDSLGRTLGETSFDRLLPSATISGASPPVSVPHDTVITLTSTATDDVQRVVLVSDVVTLPPLCPEDIWERDYNDDVRSIQVPEISPDDDSPQIHNFSANDEDWVFLRVYPGSQSIYTFTACPLAPGGVPISLTLHHGGESLITRSNLSNPQSPVLIGRIISCGEQYAFCRYFLQIQSSESGCGTEYSLWVAETPIWTVWLPVVLRN